MDSIRVRPPAMDSIRVRVRPPAMDSIRVRVRPPAMDSIRVRVRPPAMDSIRVRVRPPAMESGCDLSIDADLIIDASAWSANSACSSIGPGLPRGVAVPALALLWPSASSVSVLMPKEDCGPEDIGIRPMWAFRKWASNSSYVT